MATILAVFAHPDDETFICGGTLAKYAYEGHLVVLVCATKGEAGRRLGIPPVATRESLPQLREQELKNACKALKIDDLRFLGFRDKLLEIQPFEILTKTVLEQMYSVKPDVVITFHEILGGHPDHCTIGLATKTAYKQYDLRSKVNLFYVSWANIAQNPEIYGVSSKQMVKINVKKYNIHKLNAFRSHKTQAEMDKWVWENDDVSLNYLQDYEYFIKDNLPYSNKHSLV